MCRIPSLACGVRPRSSGSHSVLVLAAPTVGSQVRQKRTVLNGTRTHFIDGTSNRPGEESYRTAVSVCASRCQPDVDVAPVPAGPTVGVGSGLPSPCSTVTPGGCQD